MQLEKADIKEFEESLWVERMASLAKLYPDFTEDQLKEADDNLTRYLEVVLRIYERLHADTDYPQPPR